jgi:hypothetical protein
MPPVRCVRSPPRAGGTRGSGGVDPETWHVKEGVLKMLAYKFAVGQMVRFSPDLSQVGAAGRGGSYKVVRLLPDGASFLHYRVKSELPTPLG